MSTAGDLTSIDCNYQEVSSLDGLEAFTNLRDLRLDGSCRRLDLAPIGGLIKLDYLGWDGQEAVATAIGTSVGSLTSRGLTTAERTPHQWGCSIRHNAYRFAIQSATALDWVESRRPGLWGLGKSPQAHWIGAK